MNTPSSSSAGGGNPAGLFLAWLWVGIPLIWGVWLTLNNALKLFQTPT